MRLLTLVCQAFQGSGIFHAHRLKKVNKKILFTLVNRKQLFTFVIPRKMKCSDLLRLLTRNGWIIERMAKGSHKILMHPDKKGIQITFPDHGSGEISKGIASKILKQAGLR